ncbi:MAG: hypothetical protein ABI646_03400, partial [Acidobacteriota bacterium]
MFSKIPVFFPDLIQLMLVHVLQIQNRVPRPAARPYDLIELYLKSLSEGLFDGPGRDPVIRAKLEGQVLELGAGEMHERLRA